MFLQNRFIVSDFASSNLLFVHLVFKEGQSDVVLKFDVHISVDLVLHVIDGLQDSVDGTVSHSATGQHILHLVGVLHLVEFLKDVIDVSSSCLVRVVTDARLGLELDNTEFM